MSISEIKGLVPLTIEGTKDVTNYKEVENSTFDTAQAKKYRLIIINLFLRWLETSLRTVHWRRFDVYYE